MVFGLVFQRITVGTSQKKSGPIKFAVYIAAMGPQMLNFNSVWRGNLTEIALVMKILTELFCDIRLRIRIYLHGCRKPFAFLPLKTQEGLGFSLS